ILPATSKTHGRSLESRAGVSPAKSHPTPHTSPRYSVEVGRPRPPVHPPPATPQLADEGVRAPRRTGKAADRKWGDLAGRDACPTLHQRGTLHGRASWAGHPSHIEKKEPAGGEGGIPVP